MALITPAERLRFATLTFSDQKNAVRGEQVGHLPTDDEWLCPVKALARIAVRLRQANAPATTAIDRFFNQTTQKWYSTKSTHVTTALRHSARYLQDETGIPFWKVSTRSLRSGGATALLVAHVEPHNIKLLGRWKSDAMLDYLRQNVTMYTNHFSQQMLTHGGYTFAPGALATTGLPEQTPPDLMEAAESFDLSDDEA